MAGGEDSRQRSRRAAACGMMCALSLLFLLVGVIPGLEYCGPVLAMLPQLPVVERWGGRWALGVYGATAALGILLALQPEASLVYLCLGWYPALRPALQGLPRWQRRAAKSVVFACAAGGIFLGSLLLLGPGAVWTAEASAAMGGLLLALGGLTFFLLDLALERLQRAWGPRWRRWMLR